MAKNSALGNVDPSRDYNAGGHSAGTTGAQMTMTPQRGLGAKMVSDLESVKKRYARVKAAEKRADAQYEAQLRRAEREANAFAELDSLLDDIQG